MTTEHHGACMCGSLRFSFVGDPKFVAECVCESCRRAHGASAVAWVGVRTEQFKIDDGESHLEWFQSSAESERGFCRQCGTRILFRSEKWPGEVHMALASLTEPHDLVATRVVFANELPAWTAMRPKT